MISGSTLRSRFLIADDDSVFRDVARLVLQSVPQVEIVGETQTVVETVALCRRFKPSFLLLDWRLADGEGIHVLRELNPEMPALRTIMFTAFPRDALSPELMMLGVCAFLDKATGVVEILRALEEVREGGLYYRSRIQPASPPRGHAPLARSGRDLADTCDTNITPADLTAREREIASLAADGYSSKEIAARLFLSVRTIEKHRGNIYRKIKVTDVVSLTRWWLSQADPGRP